MKNLMFLSLILSGCVGTISDPSGPVSDPSLDICDLNVLAPRQIGGLGARSDTLRTLAIYEYVDRHGCAPVLISCADNDLRLTCGEIVQNWSLDESSVVSGYHATLTVTQDGSLFDTEKLTLGTAEQD